MMEYDAVVIGFGKGGKTLAAKLAVSVKLVAVKAEFYALAVEEKKWITEMLRRKNFEKVDSL